jgi:two-component system cell cycle response regulator DivK
VSATILLVEDVEDNRELVRLLLESAGHLVVEAHTGQEALDCLAAGLPDLILMDLSLPTIDGWEVTRRLRLDGRTAALPIIALTAHAMAGDRDRVLASGFDGYIAKPIDVSTFLSQVVRHLS